MTGNYQLEDCFEANGDGSSTHGGAEAVEAASSANTHPRSRIRVAHVVGSLQYGGAENQVVQYLNGLDPQKIDGFLIVFKIMETGVARGLHAGVTRIHVPLKRWGQIQCICRLTRLFKTLKLDVVQSHMFHTNLYVAIAAKLAGVPVAIATEHGRNFWKNPLPHFIEKHIISPLTSMRVAVSSDLMAHYVQAGDAPEERIRVVPNCVHIPEGVAEPRQEGRIRIGTVGRMVWEKDYGNLIDAFKLVIEAGIDAELVFVGDGSERPMLEARAEELLLADRILFPGFQSDVRSFLKSFDIFVLSSVWEGLPVSMLEAMAMHLPVVATKVGGIPEVIQDGVDGLLVESRDPEKLAGALIRLSENPSLRKTIGAAGHGKVKSAYSREAICRRYENLYFELLAKCGCAHASVGLPLPAVPDRFQHRGRGI
jgi:glycosyltransferase involved in cell wall biosynthesis